MVMKIDSPEGWIAWKKKKYHCTFMVCDDRPTAAWLVSADEGGISI
jgi:hypothetical protein